MDWIKPETKLHWNQGYRVNPISVVGWGGTVVQDLGLQVRNKHVLGMLIVNYFKRTKKIYFADPNFFFEN